MMDDGDRLYLLAELCMVERLVQLRELNDIGLDNRRAWLRHDAVVRDATQLRLGERRAQVLDAVCRAIGQRNPERLGYYAAAGDLLAAVPDDASRLAG